jgi:hypothetical protein
MTSIGQRKPGQTIGMHVRPEERKKDSIGNVDSDEDYEGSAKFSYLDFDDIEMSEHDGDDRNVVGVRFHFLNFHRLQLVIN